VAKKKGERMDFLRAEADSEEKIKKNFTGKEGSLIGGKAFRGKKPRKSKKTGIRKNLKL